MKTIQTLITCLLFYSGALAVPITNMVKIDTRLYSGATIIDANVVVFDVAYSNAVDGDDALKMSNSGENFAIQRGNAALVVEGRQPAVVNDEVPFKMWNMRPQVYRLEIITANLLTPGLVAVLEDAYLHTAIALNPNGTTTVNFTVNSNAGAAASNRFRIIFREADPGPLPVTFISAGVQRITGAVVVNWKVAGENNVLYYEVERSADGIHFSKTGSTAALGNSANEHTYNINDYTAPATTLFYRVNSVDKDGKNKYSSIVKVNAGNTGQELTVIANPVQNALLQVRFRQQAAGRYSIKLFSSAGACIVTGLVNHAGSNATESFSLPATMPHGIYRLQINTPGNLVINRAVIID